MKITLNLSVIFELSIWIKQKMIIFMLAGMSVHSAVINSPIKIKGFSYTKTNVNLETRT